VKPHPLDPFPWRCRDDLAMEADGDERVVWLPGGDLSVLWPRLNGVVTVNSTVGLSALLKGVPVFALGRAVYAPLAQTDGLDGFWVSPATLNANRTADFVSALAAATQVRGAFDGEGMTPGAEAVAARLLEQEAL
jgi:capsular polysaccharide export protein